MIEKCCMCINKCLHFTEYIYGYGLGLQAKEYLRVMKMNMDYWDAIDNI